MVGLLGLVLVAAALTAWAHRRAPAPDGLALRRDLVLFASASLAQALLLALGRSGASPWARAALTLAALCGFVTWLALARLVARDTRVRDLWIRVPALLLAGLALVAGSWRASLLLATFAILSYRWKSKLETLSLFQLAMLAIVLAVVELSAPGPSLAKLTGWDRAIAGWALVSSKAAGAYAAYGSLVLLMGFVRDPTLGIRPVGRRLALSHALVVLVPLLLVLALWTSMTVLGVNQERVHVGTRALERESDRLGDGLQVALATGDGTAGPLLALARLHALDWPGLRIWRRTSGRVEQACGIPLAEEAAVGAWLDSLGALPDRGMVALGDSLYLGAAAHLAGQEAVALTPIPPLVPALVEVAGAPLTIRANAERVLSTEGPAAWFGPDSAGSASIGLGMFTRGYVLTRGLTYDRGGWTRSSFMISGGSPASRALSGLFDLSPENPLGYLPFVLLANVAFFFALIAIWNVIMVVNVGRGITREIGALRAGDLGHRIDVRGRDDL